MTALTDPKQGLRIMTQADVQEIKDYCCQLGECTATYYLVMLLEQHKRLAALHTLRPANEWYEDCGSVLWWRWPIVEPPHVGTPLDDDWIEDYYTHWSPLPYNPSPKNTRTV